MSTEGLSPAQLSAAVLDVATTHGVRDEAKDRVEHSRTRARELLLPYAQAGLKSLQAFLPAGNAVGTLSFVQPAPRVRWDQEAITTYVSHNAPSEIEEDIDPAILANPDVVAWLIENHPEALRRSVRPTYLARLEQELDHEGHLPDPQTGEALRVATVSTPAPTGQFQWKADHEQRSELLAAVREGHTEHGADLLTLLPHAPHAHDDALAETPAFPESPAIGIDHLSQLHDRLHSAGMSEHGEALSFIAQTLGVRVHSRKELTLDQWRTVMDALAPGQATAKAG